VIVMRRHMQDLPERSESPAAEDVVVPTHSVRIEKRGELRNYSEAVLSEQDLADLIVVGLRNKIGVDVTIKLIF